MTNDPGSVALAVLRILALGPRSLADVHAALPQYATPRVTDAVERLRADGLVMTKWKRLELTKAGRAAAPVTSPALASQGVYRPERVVRRMGTEIHRTLPSRVGGALYYREQA